MRFGSEEYIDGVTLMPQEFYEKLMQSKDKPLKILTGDCHYHTIAAPSEKLLVLIEQALQKDGFLR